jgi:hypothetical protein
MRETRGPSGELSAKGDGDLRSYDKRNMWSFDLRRLDRSKLSNLHRKSRTVVDKKTHPWSQLRLQLKEGADSAKCGSLARRVRSFPAIFS